jgi:hypothetical protein
MSDSILTSVKKNLGLEEEYTAYDADVLTHINTVFTDLLAIGIGPPDGFFITDSTATWDQFLGVNEAKYGAVKTLMYLQVKNYFDPPQTSYHLTAAEEQIKKLEVRLNTMREDEEWTDPNPPLPSEEEL